MLTIPYYETQVRSLPGFEVYLDLALSGYLGRRLGVSGLGPGFRVEALPTTMT